MAVGKDKVGVLVNMDKELKAKLESIAKEWSDWDRRYPPQNYDEWKLLLKGFKGIGEKVANCICLFSLHYLDAFPVDTHIRKILDREYGGELPDWAFEKYAGLFQQYLFYYELAR